jgi:hypothetical protein
VVEKEFAQSSKVKKMVPVIFIDGGVQSYN